MASRNKLQLRKFFQCMPFLTLLSEIVCYVSAGRMKSCRAERNKNIFRRVTSMLFGFHQSRGMGTSKRLAWIHVVEAVRHVESIAYPDAVCFESSHNSFKKHYKEHQKNSKFHDWYIGERNFKSIAGTILQPVSKCKTRNSSSIKSVMEDKRCWCTGRMAALDLVRERKKLEIDLNERGASKRRITDHILPVVDDLQEYELATLSNLVPEWMKSTGCGGYSYSRKPFRLVTYTYCSGYAIQTIGNPTYGNSGYPENLWRKKICQIVPSLSFFGSSRKRFEVIMFENSKNIFHVVL